ncbi:MAG TPA: hypothetical protein PKD26_07785 [Pyrinomonadaceae bacterium]|nr:hypothetical protein [Pyrinomonadaceae bacterium]
MKSKTDWSLIVQGNISLLWIQETLNRKDKKVEEILIDFRNRYEGLDPLNPGLLMMASYLLFVYPQQAEFEALDFSRIKTGDFEVKEGTSTADARRFCSRIRNSLTHARFELIDERIEFRDERSGNDLFHATVEISKFGEFVNDFFFEAIRQHFRSIEAPTTSTCASTKGEDSPKANPSNQTTKSK